MHLVIAPSIISYSSHCRSDETASLFLCGYSIGKVIDEVLTCKSSLEYTISF